MDPNTQVALVGVLATMITTIGVVAVAVINNRRGSQAAASAGVEAGLDETDVLDKIVQLVAENERKDRTIADLEEEIADLRKDNQVLLARIIEEGKSP